MIFTSEQVTELLNILDYHNLFVISTNLGIEVLSEQDRDLMKMFGVDLEMFSKEMPVYEKMFLFGRLTSVLNEIQAKEVEYSDFLKYVQRGQYIPLNTRERFELDIAKRKTYTYLKGIREKSKGDFEGIILGEEQKRREEYETAVKEEIKRGVIDRKSVQSIVSDLGHKFDTWAHDWNRIVETEMQNIFQQGKAETLESAYGTDVEVYKTVHPMACRHCIKAYLTHGLDGKPRVFKLSKLKANGTNIGRRVEDWLPVLGTMHPYCRCDLKYVPKQYVWSEKKQKFIMPEEIERRVIRHSKVKITVGNKVFEV